MAIVNSLYGIPEAGPGNPTAACGKELAAISLLQHLM